MGGHPKRGLIRDLAVCCKICCFRCGTTRLVQSSIQLHALPPIAHGRTPLSFSAASFAVCFEYLSPRNEWAVALSRSISRLGLGQTSAVVLHAAGSVVALPAVASRSQYTLKRMGKHMRACPTTARRHDYITSSLFTPDGDKCQVATLLGAATSHTGNPECGWTLPSPIKHIDLSSYYDFLANTTVSL